MDNLETRPLFTVSNHQGPDAGPPPAMDGDAPHLYHGYFENKFGEQSIFVYNRDTREAVLWCGDAGWKPYLVVNGRVEEIKLTEEELTWLRACWLAIS